MCGQLTADGSRSTGMRTLAVPVVEVVRVRKRWPQRTWFGRREPVAPDVLSDVTFSARRGEIVVVLGENGAGKTTLLKIVAGLARADGGVVRVLGCDADAPSPALRRCVAYAGGERGFYFRLTVRENLEFFSALDGVRARERARRIVDAARAVDIEPDLDRRFATLSSGQRQRLSIARALVTDAQVLLLDEPTRALDPPHALDLRRFVRETLAARDGKTVLVATNTMEEAVELGDRIAVLRGGALTFVDLPSRPFDEFEIRELFGISSRA